MHYYGNMIVRFLPGCPGEVVLIGKNTAKKRRCVVSSESDKHEARSLWFKLCAECIVMYLWRYMYAAILSVVNFISMVVEFGC